MRYVLANLDEETHESIIVYTSYEKDRGKSGFGKYLRKGFYFVPLIETGEKKVPVVAIILTVYNEDQVCWHDKIVSLYTDPVTAAKEYKEIKEAYNGDESMCEFAIMLFSNIVCV